MDGTDLQNDRREAHSDASRQFRGTESEKIDLYADHAIAVNRIGHSVSLRFMAFSPDAFDSFMESEPFCDLCYALFTREFGWRGGPFRGEDDCLTTLPFARKGENPSDHC